MEGADRESSLSGARITKRDSRQTFGGHWMPLYAYTAIDTSGRTVRSTMEADNEQLVLAKLRDQSLHCTDIKRSGKAKSGSGLLGKKKFKPKSLVVFSRQFATMI